ncbi:MAG TPA: TetR/AcrR family transcriptional regulator [Anaerolineales bacterium]|nr:TetR/AcrR family transcriptional regulator [Anaerolineales bacterium]
MARPFKETQTANLENVIKETAWEQIAAYGTTALSLRAIARELKITAPAIYHYFPDRDALVTALIVDAFTSFGDSQLEARDSVPKRDLAGRLRATGLAYRNWAHTYPQRYQLILGTPLPGYEASTEADFPALARSISALFSVVESIRAAGKLNLSMSPKVQEGYKVHFERWRQYVGEIQPISLFVALNIWTRVHGIVSLEIQGSLPTFGKNGDDLYLFELRSIAKQFIKE